MGSDFFTSHFGTVPSSGWRRYTKLLRAADAALDARMAGAIKRARRAAEGLPPQTVLLTATEVPGREADLAQVIARIAHGTRHQVTVATNRMQQVGKFDNINLALSGQDVAGHDWLLVVDDDIAMPDGFLDLLLYFARTYDLKLTQPAHRFRSYSMYAVTERHWASMVRRTSFVEIGPVTLLHRDTFASLLPFPSLRWAWGLDVVWAQTARQNGWTVGVVDAVPIQHLRPVGKSYSGTAARTEAAEFLRIRGVTMNRAEIFGTNRRLA